MDSGPRYFPPPLIPFFGQPPPPLPHLYGDPMPFPPQHYRQHPFHQVPRWQQSRGCAVNQPLLTYQTQLAFQPFPPPPNQAFYESAAHRPSGSDPFLLEWMERVRSTKPQSSPHSPPLKVHDHVMDVPLLIC